jgi:hypothetical protein
VTKWQSGKVAKWQSGKASQYFCVATKASNPYEYLETIFKELPNAQRVEDVEKYFTLERTKKSS